MELEKNKLLYVYLKYLKNNSYKNLFFIFLLYNTLTAKLHGNVSTKTKKLGIFVDKTTFSFHSINKVNDFVTIQ